MAHPISSLLPALAVSLLACGQPAAEAPEPEPTTGDDEPVAVEPEPPPPPPASHLRAIHASPEALLTSGSVRVGEIVLADALEYRTASAYTELRADTALTLSVFGVPSAETGQAAQLASAELPALVGDSHHTVLIYGALATEPALSIAHLADRDAPPDAEHGALRFFGGMIEVPSIDLCTAGATRRAPAEPLLAAVAAGQSAPPDSYLAIPATTMTLQVRIANSQPCRGSLIGQATLDVTPATNTTIVLLGRTSRPRVDAELLICSDHPAESSCHRAPLTTD